jgi:electron transfer flavoprotein beta subunit
VVSVGPKESEDVLFHGLAAGAEKATHIVTFGQPVVDNWMISNVLYDFIKKRPFDLVLTGVQAEDDGCAEIGPVIAYLLGIPHATMVTKAEYDQNQNEVRVIRELEGGFKESIGLKLPALLTIQTGINQPRYVSTMRLRRFKKEGTITKLSFIDIISELKVPPKVEILEFYPYKLEGSQVEWLEGETTVAVDQLLDRLSTKGVL